MSIVKDIRVLMLSVKPNVPVPLVVAIKLQFKHKKLKTRKEFALGLKKLLQKFTVNVTMTVLTKVRTLSPLTALVLF